MASHGIVPTLMYGLAASAPGLKDIQRMQHQLTRHVRAITHLFAHLSIKYPHRTQDLCRRFKLPTVLDLLHQEAHSLYHQIQTRPGKFSHGHNCRTWPHPKQLSRPRSFVSAVRHLPSAEGPRVGGALPKGPYKGPPNQAL